MKKYCFFGIFPTVNLKASAINTRFSLFTPTDGLKIQESAGTEGCALIVWQNSDWRITGKNRILTRSHVFSLGVSLSLLLPPAAQLNIYSGSDLKALTSLRHKMPKNEVCFLDFSAKQAFFFFFLFLDVGLYINYSRKR